MATRVLLTAWNVDPVVIVALLALLGSYLYAIGPLRTRFRLGAPAPRRRVIYFIGGLLLLALVVLSPLDTIGRRYLFSAHAVQLFLLITAVAPLLLAGLPEWLVARLLLREEWRAATRSLFFPLVAVLAFNGIILLWHIPRLYEASLHNLGLHNLQLLCILLAGMVDWWPLLTPMDRHTRLASPFQILYLGAESLPLDLFGLITIFSRAPFYPTYAAAPRVFGISALLDQQLAGGIIAVPNNIIDFILMSVVFFGWIARMEDEQRARDQAEAERDLSAQVDIQVDFSPATSPVPAQGREPAVGGERTE
jgi:cytochrome c oxidase assembly factor CtaG